MELQSAKLRAEPVRLGTRATWGSLPLLALGLVLGLRPSVLGGRFEPTRAAAETVAPYLGAALVLLSVGAVLWPRCSSMRARMWLQCGLAASVYSVLSLVFREWHVDDAAITYAYSENLVRGFGLVLHPSHVPEEAYSSTLWMLMLALLRSMGMEVALGAKVLATLIGAGSTALAFVILREILGKPVGGPGFALTLAGFTVSPVLIWTVSGLEHGLQTFVFMGLVWSTLSAQRLMRWAPLLGAMLVLLRPEAPLVLAGFGLAVTTHVYLQHRTLASVLALWPIAALPALTLGSLLAFRLVYFGDLMPTPYYAKVHGSGLLRLINPFSGGYRYVLDWLGRGGGFLLLAPLFSGALRRAPLAVRAALGIVLGQLAFVAYAGGDWMEQWRFLAAPIAVLALLSGYAIQHVESSTTFSALKYAGFAVGALCFSNLLLLVSFRATPTTPYATVTAIGQNFVQLADKLGIREPVLAHHDAGGTSYPANIAMIDLAGLGDRVIAKHLDDPEFLRKYILEDRKPDFIFGVGDEFAAGASRFQDTEAFKRDYVRVEFRGQPYMDADLCHVRRERVQNSETVTVEQDGTLALRTMVQGGHMPKE